MTAPARTPTWAKLGLLAILTLDLWLRKRLTVTVGAPLPPAGHTAESLTAAGREAVLSLLGEPVEGGGRRLLQRRLTHLF